MYSVQNESCRLFDQETINKSTSMRDVGLTIFKDITRSFTDLTLFFFSLIIGRLRYQRTQC